MIVEKEYMIQDLEEILRMIEYQNETTEHLMAVINSHEAKISTLRALFWLSPLLFFGCYLVTKFLGWL